MILELYEFGKNSVLDAHFIHWWNVRHGEKVDPVALLPKHGYMAFDDGKPIGALFLYLIEQSPAAFLAWPTVNPKSTKEQRDWALNLLFDKLHEDAKEKGYKAVMTTSGIPVIQERLINHGYNVGDENITQYWKGL